MRRCAPVIVVLAAAGPAQASLVGLAMRWQTTASLTSGDDVHVFRVHAIFDEPSVLLNVFDTAWVSDIPFYQTGVPFGGDVVASSGFFGFDSDLQYDTWVTLGDPDAADGTDTTVDPAFVMGASTITGGWFDSNPGTQDGQTDASSEVLIAQISVLVEDYSGSFMAGTIGVTYFDAGGGTVQEIWPKHFGGIQFEGPPPPAPGSGVVLLAGLGMASRRRR